MLDEMTKICNTYKVSNSSIKLFAILKMDDLVDKWSVILATDRKQNQDERRAEYKKLIDLLTENLDESELKDIARIGYFDDETHLISELSKYQIGAKLDNVKVNGNYVYEGYILCSNNK